MKKVLFIEDEATLQKTISDILEKDGHKVISALNGKIGLELAKKEKPDLIILDLILPKVNGFDVLKELKNGELTKDIPVVILTNLESASDVERAIEIGAKTYLVKANYNLQEVIDKLRKIISQS